MTTKVLQRITYIFIPTLLLAAFLLAKPHESKPQPNHERLQWSGKADHYVSQSVTPSNTVDPAGIDTDLLVSAQSLNAHLQLSLRLKPFGNHLANPYGSGTFTIGGNKYPFLADSKSALQLHELKDGTVFVDGPMDVALTKPYGQARVTFGISYLLDTGEAEIQYQNPDGKGTVIFGKGIPSHADELKAIRKSEK